MAIFNVTQAEELKRRAEEYCPKPKGTHEKDSPVAQWIRDAFMAGAKLHEDALVKADALAKAVGEFNDDELELRALDAAYAAYLAARKGSDERKA